jgi:DNA-binding MarR family transcriptional regulator
MIEAQRLDTEIRRSQRFYKAPRLDELVVNASNFSADILTAYTSGRFTMRQIAEQLGVHYSTVGRIIARSEILHCKT